MRWWSRGVHELGRIRVRLLVVNLVVVIIPIAGLVLGRLVERQLLNALQRDMTNQATLARSWAENDLARGVPLGSPHHSRILEESARKTRTRIRLIDRERRVVADSHAHGPPEGKEPDPPYLVWVGETPGGRRMRPSEPPDPPLRREVLEAFEGNPSAHTRIARRPSAVYLFVAEPIRQGAEVVGVVYVVRSTTPVLLELHRVRRGLIYLLAAALTFTALSTLALAWTISRPLSKLSAAARRIAAGERNVVVPLSGGGEITELAASFRVMTERLDARLRYISEFAADVAHEFKSPLTSIRGAAELLSEGAADEPEARARFLHNIELDVARLDRLVSRLLELSRIEAATGVMAVVPVREWVERAVERAQTPEGSVVLEFDSTSQAESREYSSRREPIPPPAVLGREADLDAALNNLLDNALRFCPEEGTVTVRVMNSGPHRVAIEVADEGPGIDSANLPRVFDRFFTTESERDGTGLGLAIVKSVALAHGGSVAVTSPPGEGATFRIELPTMASPQTARGLMDLA